MERSKLASVYTAYIACLNSQDWANLAQFVDGEVTYNGRRVGLPGYREMLQNDYRHIPDLHFTVDLLISDPPFIASRLNFDCTPRGTFLGLTVDGKRISFSENVFYEFREAKILRVWSIIDKNAIENQLSMPPES